MENTKWSSYLSILIEDHLHTRGEYSALSFQNFKKLGSPPHSWRIQQVTISDSCLVRITSTLVENTNCLYSWGFCSKDHLHTRGEYPALVVPTFLLLGSPPHSWRIQGQLQPADYKKRITSTLVENTWLHQRQKLKFWDHLHTRGEYSSSNLGRNMFLGSPPHSWRIH